MPPPDGAAWRACPSLSQRDFARIREMAYYHAGIELRDGKQHLVEARLAPLIRQSHVNSFEEYCDSLTADRSGRALEHMLDALTTKHTAFLREPEHFDFLKTELRRRWGAAATVDVWSAACASGEEAYSIVFCAAEEGRSGRCGVRVLATDLSDRALTIARTGEYPAARLNVLPPAWTRSFFVRAQQRDPATFRVRPEVRAAIEFRRLNLIGDAAPARRFQVIFCRNVMIYMDRAMQQRALRLLISRLDPGGILFTGHAESLSGMNHDLVYVQPSIYRRPEGCLR
jgi:chemotaxis protein methyltransferase CheR